MLRPGFARSCIIACSSPASALARTAAICAPASKQARRLAIDDLAVSFFGGVRVVHIHELHDFAGSDRIGRVGQNLHDAHAVDIDHHLEGARIQEVTDQHAGLVAEHSIGGILPVCAATTSRRRRRAAVSRCE